MSDGKDTTKSVKKLRFVFVGDAGTGAKSALIKRFVMHKFFPDYDPPIEDSFRTEICIDGSMYVLDIIDTNGQEDPSVLAKQYCETADVVVVGFAVNWRGSFEDTDHYIKCLRSLEHPPLIIAVGNKIDLTDVREVSTEEAREHFENMTPSVPYIEASAKTGENVEKVFQDPIRLLFHQTDKSKKNDGPTKCLIN